MNDYMKKTLKVTLYGLKSKWVFIALIFPLSLGIVAAWKAVTGEYGGGSKVVVAAILGVVLPIEMFGYLHKRTARDFYSSMPIKRSQYFFGHLITCVIAFLIAYIPLNLVFAIYPEPFGENFLQGLEVFLVMFAVTVLAVMLSGSLLSTLVTLFILNFAVFEIADLIILLCQVDESVYFSSKFVNVIEMLSPFMIIGNIDNNAGFLTVFLMLLMAVVHLVIAFFLHRYRKNESTAAVAFPKTRYIFQYIVMFMVALLVSTRETYSYIYLGGYYGEGKTFSRFIRQTFEYPCFFPYSFIAIFITFVIVNMIFEKTPRGVFKKIRHLFIFTLGYSVFYLLIVGGLLYTSMPFTFVPFDSDLVLVSVYKYEEKGRVLRETEEDEFYYNGGYFKEPQEAVSIDRSENEETAEPSDSYFINILQDQNNAGKWYAYFDGDKYNYYFKQTDTTVYAVTDKKYINQLSKRVRKTDIRHTLVLGHNEILADSIYSADDFSDDWMNELIKNGDVYVCRVQFFDLSGRQLDEYISLMEQDVNSIGSFEPKDKYSIRTYIESEEAFEEFKSHAAYSVVNPETEPGNVQLYFNN